MARLGRSYPVNRIFAPVIAHKGPIFDATSNASDLGGSATSLSWSHTGAPGSTLIVSISLVATSATLSTAQYNGSNMTLLNGLASGSPTSNAETWLYKATVPDASAHTIAFTFSGAAYCAGAADSYRNVASVGAAQTTSGNSANLSQTVSCGANQIIVQAFATRSFSMASPSGGTNRNLTGISTLSDATATTTFTATGTFAGFQEWCAIATVLQ